MTKQQNDRLVQSESNCRRQNKWDSIKKKKKKKKEK